jgi:hypothetical protein
MSDGRFWAVKSKANDRVLVSLSAAQATPLIKGTNYLFVGLPLQTPDAGRKTMLGNRTKVKVAVHLGAYNRPFE